ncbi:hypothetical protein [Moraxella oblonga]|uniref:hypothetical protein n=1 Tax=Moraxella oblonga TaxID=200413 RepID=UPI000833D58A|nr:hypothetical protein [Moraxella oblonga]
MNILIKIQTNSELISYEAISLAFVLASFDHKIQLMLGINSRSLFLDKGTRIYGMIQSLDLYDLPQAWVDFDVSDVDVLQNTQKVDILNLQNFDSILEF